MNILDRLRELGERMVARSQHCENTKDAIAMQEHAAELDAILRESEAQGDAGAVASITDEMRKRAKFIDEMSGGDDFLDMFAEELRQWANRIDQKLAASATPRSEPAERREAVAYRWEERSYSGGWDTKYGATAPTFENQERWVRNVTPLYTTPPAGDAAPELLVALKKVAQWPRRPHPAITHCEGCGCDWLDNGLNPVGCPYCKLCARRASHDCTT